MPTVLGLLLIVALVRYVGSEGPDVDRTLLNWTLGAFALHLVLGIVIWHSPTAVRYLGGDALQYHQGGVQLAQHWAGNAFLPDLPKGKEGFFYVLGALDYLFGPHAEAGLAVNAALAAGLVPIMFDVTRRLFGRAAAGYVAPLVVLVPGFLLWTSQLLREPGVIFCVALAANFAVRLSERTRVSALLGLGGPRGCDGGGRLRLALLP